jgi:hypothetical protein
MESPNMKFQERAHAAQLKEKHRTVVLYSQFLEEAIA